MLEKMLVTQGLLGRNKVFGFLTTDTHKAAYLTTVYEERMRLHPHISSRTFCF